MTCFHTFSRLFIPKVTREFFQLYSIRENARRRRIRNAIIFFLHRAKLEKTRFGWSSNFYSRFFAPLSSTEVAEKKGQNKNICYTINVSLSLSFSFSLSCQSVPALLLLATAAGDAKGKVTSVLFLHEFPLFWICDATGRNANYAVGFAVECSLGKIQQLLINRPVHVLSPFTRKIFVICESNNKYY